MQLSRHKGILYGDYFYEGTGFSINLGGDLSPDGHFTLTAQDEGQETASFNGVVSVGSQEGKGGVVLTGMWAEVNTGAGHHPPLPFRLAEEIFDLGPGMGLLATRINRTSKNPKYRVEVVYPRISRASGGAAAFNRQIESLIQKRVIEFEKDARVAVPLHPDDELGYLEITYQVILASTQLISISFFVNEDWGGAHPNSYSVSVTYDLKPARQLALKDLFTAGSPYLEMISKDCVTKLEHKLGHYLGGSIEIGASPTAENYKNWNVTTSGLQITFDPYQVAAYGFGSQIVFVQYSYLKALINPAGPLAAFFK